MKKSPISAKEHKERVAQFIEKQMDTFLAILEQGKTEPWIKPWQNTFQGLSHLPHNPQTKHRYQGSNMLFLMFDMMAHNWDDSRFLTLNQAKQYAEENGLDPKKVWIKKGEKATYILQPFVIKPKGENSGAGKHKNSSANEVVDKVLGANGDTSPKNAEDEERSIVIFKTVPRFNGSQFVGLPELHRDLEEKNWNENALVKHLIKTNGIELGLSDKAAYAPGPDKITMPSPDAFSEEGRYTSTLLHEFYHWTGGEKREGRLTTASISNQTEYAKEEIRAQFFMISASTLLNIPIEIKQDADYIAFYKDKGGIDYKAVFKEFRESSKMFNEMLVPFILEEQPQLSWFPDKSTWPERSAAGKDAADVAEANLLSMVLEDAESVPEGNQTYVFDLISGSSTDLDNLIEGGSLEGRETDVFDLVSGAPESEDLALERELDQNETGVFDQVADAPGFDFFNPPAENAPLEPTAEPSKKNSTSVDPTSVFDMVGGDDQEYDFFPVSPR